ncbi:conserved hypothetical protein [Ricinus communis]|uniref:Uncharacterized protein n=1 Tax=Ricinus communis TaxID=3988 RepID=B9RAS5_RICCO|nr:conserved hypothetical protein [Ricinus communis]
MHGGAKVEHLNVKETPSMSVHRKLPLVAVATPYSFWTSWVHLINYSLILY